MSPEDWLKQQEREAERVDIISRELAAAENRTDARAAGDVKALKAELSRIKVVDTTPKGVTPMSPEEWLASQAKAPAQQGTTVEGLAGAATRGLAPVAAGATLGAALGAPTGIGIVPGAIAGAGAGALAATVGDPIVGLVNNVLGTKFTEPTQALENLMTRLGVAQPKTEAERILQSTVQGAAGAGGIASAGQTMASMAASPVTRAVGTQLAAQPAAQIAGGAGAGLAGQSAQEAGFGPAGQVAASLAGGMAGASMALPRGVRPNVAPDLQAAKQAGVSVKTSDIMPPRTFAAKWLQKTGEQIPLAGTGGMRQSQQQERIDAVRQVLRDFGADDAAKATDQVMADLAAKRGADLKKYTQMKTGVVSNVPGNVPMARTVQAVDDEIIRLQSLKTEEMAGAVARLQDWKQAIQSQPLENVESLRKMIGQAFKAPELSTIRTEAEKSLSRIYGPLKQDMGEYIKNTAGTREFTKWMVANKRLSEMAGELESTTLKSVLKSGNARPEDVRKMLFSAKPSEVRQLYSSLTPSGRASARAAILAEAAEKSARDVAEGKVVSPDVFANQVKRLGNSVGVMFTGDDLKQVNGLVRVLDITKRAAEASVNPNTGASLAIPVGASALTAVFGGGLPGFVAGLGAAGAAGGAARLYESAPVRNALIALGKTAPKTKEEAALIKRLASIVQNPPTEK
jgi:hypothetical protein